MADDQYSESHADGFVRSLDRLFADAIRGARDELEVLQDTLDAGMAAVRGKRGFLALVNHETGELEVRCTAGPGWTKETRRMRLHLGQETSRGITGHVALTGQAYITGDVRTDPYYLQYFDDVVSEIAVPILGAQGQTRGVINIDSPAANAFGATDCVHLSALAHSAAAALALRGFRARETALVAIGNQLTRTLEIDALMSRVVDVAARVLEFEDCSVFLLDEQTDSLALKASAAHYVRGAEEAALRVGEGLAGWVAEHGEPVRIEDAPADARWSPRIAALEEAQIGPYLAVPIWGRDRTLGVLRVIRRKSDSPWFSNRFTETDERVLGTIASQLGAAVENAGSFQRLARAERMAAWGELSARSAHMIGNRAFALRGDLNELRYVAELLPADERRHELMELVRSMEGGLEKLDGILREFRDYVVATQVARAPFDLNMLLREAVEESFPKRSNVSVKLELESELPSLRLDGTRLKRAFSELIENAVSFQPGGGELQISSRRLSAAERVEYRLSAARDYVLVEFADRGPGVRDEIKSRIFQPFFTSRVKGMGLGLSIVKGIVEAHDGVIRETGVSGQGARFQIFLPSG